MFNLHILSKDRPMQLRALLDSIKKNAPHLFRISVQWVASDDRYINGYVKLFGEADTGVTHPIVFNYNDFDGGLRNNYIRAMKDAGDESGFFCICTDDTIFYRPLTATVEDIKSVFDDQTLCFSFRLGLNTIIQNYETQEFQPPLTTIEHIAPAADFQRYMNAYFTHQLDHKYDLNELTAIRWNYTEYHPHKNYGYPIAQDAHMYRVEDILPITKELQFDVFRSWEGVLAGDWRNRFAKIKMAAFPQSAAVNIPTNNVQVPPIPCGQRFPVSTRELNDMYLAGQVVDLTSMDFGNVRGAHQEIALCFR